MGRLGRRRLHPEPPHCERELPHLSLFLQALTLLLQGGDTIRALGLKKPLFQAAITSSVFLPPQVEYNAPSVEKAYKRLASAVNCTGAASSFDCLAKVDAAKLAAAAFANAAAAPWAVWTYVPVIDGSFLRDRASVLLKQGRARLNGVRRQFSSESNVELTLSVHRSS